MREKIFIVMIMSSIILILLLVGCTKSAQPAPVQSAVCGNNVIESGEQCDNSECSSEQICDSCTCQSIPAPPALPEG